MNLVTVIPARAGSKSIPFKNIQLLNNKPLIYYSIVYSRNCSFISHTVVSTDSKQIASVAEELGAEVPFLRPQDISGDDVEDFPVISHALNELENFYGKKIDAIILLRPTSPLRPEKLIERAIDILDASPECTSIRSVVRSNEHPYRQWVMNNGFISGFVRSTLEPYNLPRQKLPVVYFQSGDIEVIRRETIINGSISGGYVLPLIIKKEEMLDIDEFDDLRRASLKLLS